jgi:hypothetical protein
MSGERKHGFGLDSLRAWAITMDSDKSFNIDVKDIEKAN